LKVFEIIFHCACFKGGTASLETRAVKEKIIPAEGGVAHLLGGYKGKHTKPYLD
jgi:hypothetical protein